MKNKLYIFILFFVGLAIMARYKITIIHDYTKNNDMMPENFLVEPNDSELQYFDSIEEALKSSDFEHFKVTDLRNIVKVVENDNECVVLFVNRGDGKDYLYANKLRIKKDGKKIYSQTLFGTGRQWYLEKVWINELHKICGDNELLKGKVESDLLLFNNKGEFTIGEKGGNIRWGTYFNEDIYKLSINGNRPTEIIKFQMDDEPVYLWYYKNLELNEEQLKNVQISY